MSISLSLPSVKQERVLLARIKRLGTPVHEILRYQGWEGLVVQELSEARSRLNDQLAGGEDLILEIEAEADRVVASRAAQKDAV